MSDHPARSCRSSQSGFTLVEALVAIVVLAWGLIGFATLHLGAMKSAHVAQQRSIASIAAQDAAERLWFHTASPDDWEALCAATAPVTAASSGPLGQAFADWETAWAGLFPGFAGEITPMDPGCQFRIRVAWDDQRFTLGASAEAAGTPGAASPSQETVSDLLYSARLPMPTADGSVSGE